MKENKQLLPAIYQPTRIQQLPAGGVLAALTPTTCHPPSLAKRKQAGEAARAQPHPRLTTSGSTGTGQEPMVAPAEHSQARVQPHRT